MVATVDNKAGACLEETTSNTHKVVTLHLSSTIKAIRTTMAAEVDTGSRTMAETIPMMLKVRLNSHTRRATAATTTVKVVETRDKVDQQTACLRISTTIREMRGRQLEEVDHLVDDRDNLVSLASKLRLHD